MAYFSYADEISNLISDKDLFHKFRVKMRAADFAIKYEMAKITARNNYRSKK